jgi:hypothetical protein
MANELKVGDRRYGNIVDGDPDTPTLHATLERTEKGVSFSMTFDHEETPAYRRWFTTDGLIAVDGTEDTKPVGPPSNLMFEDSHGQIALLGCRAVGWHTNYQTGYGTIQASAAVIGAPSTTYAKITGLQSEVSGLRSWVGATSVDDDWSRDPETKKMKLTVVLEAPDPISIPDSGLSLAPNFAYSTKNGTVSIRDVVNLVHHTEQEEPWHVHQEAQSSVRDLLAISRWRAETVTPAFVSRPDDLLPDGEDQAIGRPWWRKAVYSGLPSPMEETTKVEHLIWWNELKPEGMAKWIKLRRDFTRAVEPVVSSIYNKDSMIESQLTQVAIGLEALGYLIAMRDDGSTEKEANDLSFKQRLIRISQDVPGILPFVNDAWAQSMATTYNSVKHVNRPPQQLPIVANSWREGTLLFRAWIVAELGLDHEVIKSRIARDRLSRPMFQLDRV